MFDQLTPELKRCVELSKGGCLSSHSKNTVFYLHKGEFRDALCLCYGWKPNNTPQTCSYGALFTVDHAMICHMGDFPTIHHNEIRDITASLLTEVCNNVATKPPLQLLSRGSMTAHSANTDDGAHVDIHARSFWNISQAFVEGCCLHSHATSCRENQRGEYATLDLDLLSMFPLLGLFVSRVNR